MIDSSLTATLLTYGPLGVFSLLLVTGWLVPKAFVTKSDARHDEEIKQLKEALEHERQANNELRSTGGVTTKLIGALVSVASDKDHDVRHALPPGGRAQDTPEDLGYLCCGAGSRH